MKRKYLVPIFLLSLCLLFTACRQEPACTHQSIVTVTENKATCIEKGTLKHKCQTCDLIITQITPPGDHNFTETQTREATCKEEGIITRTCTICNTTEERSTALVAHQFDIYSLTPSVCTVCGETVADAANTPDNPWYGKNWIALGTSFSSEEQGTYMEPLAERSGLNVTALGIPGGQANTQILQSIQNTDLSQADLITIEFGVNDWASNIPLGTPGNTVPYYGELEDWNNGGTEEGTFAGACYQIFRLLQSKAPQATIIFLTESTGRAHSEEANCAQESVNQLSLFQMNYTEVAMSVARFMGVRVIDAGSLSMINQYHPDYLKDIIHHSELGGQQYALTVWMELKDIAPLL